METWKWVIFLSIIAIGIAFAKPDLYPPEIRGSMYDFRDKIIKTTSIFTDTPESRCKSAILEKYDLDIKKVRRTIEDYGGSFDFSVIESKKIRDIKDADSLLYIYDLEGKKQYVQERKYPDETIVLTIWKSKTDISSFIAPTDLLTAALSKESKYGLEVCDLEGNIRSNKFQIDPSKIVVDISLLTTKLDSKKSSVSFTVENQNRLPATLLFICGLPNKGGEPLCWEDIKQEVKDEGKGSRWGLVELQPNSKVEFKVNYYSDIREYLLDKGNSSQSGFYTPSQWIVTPGIYFDTIKVYLKWEEGNYSASYSFRSQLLNVVPVKIEVT